MREGIAALTSFTQLSAYPGRPDQAAQARRFVSNVLQESAAASDATLCVSELAANAIMHSRSGLPGGTFTVKASIAGSERIRVEVGDQGGPWALNPGGDGSGGRGLLIVSRLASDWGISGDGSSGRTIWFEIGCVPTPEPSA